MRMRLRDVAERAGVSVKTVSNVVNGYLHVAPDTRARVQAVIDETGYLPNLSARSLRSGRSGVIALALPELDMPYFAELTRSVVEAAQEQGWTVLVDQTDGLREREVLVAEGIRHNLIDGLIMSPVSLGAGDLAERSGGDLPIVLLGERLDAQHVDHVAIDNIGAARSATQHLMSLGRTRIAAIGDQPHSAVGSGVAYLRRRGWAEALTDGGLVADPALVVDVATFRRQEGAAAMRQLLASGTQPDAVFCFNDTLALGALRTLAEAGLRVPDDVAVIGIDDVEDGRYSVPTLSTIAPDKAQIARTAVQMLAQRLVPRAADAPPREARAGYVLVPRESTLGRAAG